jgi:deazaflavin-dependent oxidoreductase (nitroreductase family)
MSSSLLRRFFWLFNRLFMVPVFRLGLGPLAVNPFTGYIMVLKTVGRKTGKVRFSPVNYAIIDGQVYCLAGWGAFTHWYRNLRAEPRIELLLPGRSLSGVAEDVADPQERLTAVRRILKGAGFAGFFLGANPFTAPDDLLRHKVEGLPVIRVRLTGIGSGPADAGGWLWLVKLAVVAFLAWLVFR